MATTPNLGITLLEIGQAGKETSINAAFTLIDSSVQAKPAFLGKFATDPSVTGKIVGSTYYNTGSNKIKILIDAATWFQVG